LTLRHSRSTNTLSRQAPLPSMLIAMPLSASTPVKAAPVNCEPWSVLKISGLPCFAKASCSVSTQNAASIVIDTRHDSTRRLAQSSTTAR
jgi:type 1 fimbria pilin